MEKLKSYVDQTIYIIFLALAIITPLLFTTQTTEIYEVPKMYFVYFASTFLLTLTITKFAIDKKIKIPTGAVVISFVIFILVQIISTLFSQDKYTSVFGYPTRLNGGLISQFAYLVIFSTGIINLNTQKAKTLFVAIVFAAVAVSAWGIPSHFGLDPSCFVLTGKLTSACWQKEFDPTLRIFSTLGQPNWLASYLVLILPISLAFSLLYRQNKAKLIFAATSAIIFFAIILTNSRAGLLGLLASLAVFTALLGTKTIKVNIKYISALAVVFLIITSLFGTNLTSRLKDLIISQKPTVQQPTQATKPTQSSLTSGGTESGQIRLIIWRGAIDIIKSSPLLGTGPETFVSSYYKFRPASHNQTTEWQFFYNKAHNEFLNYLANTGILGLATYSAFLLIVLFRLTRKNPQEKLPIATKAAIASTIGYLTTIFFGFSTVATQTTFFLIIASAMVLKENEKIKSININLNKTTKVATIVLTSILGLYALTLVLRLYFADTFEKRAEAYQGTSPSRELLAYENAKTTSPAANPYLMANFAYALAIHAQDTQDPESAQGFINRANSLAQKTVSISPHNFLIIQNIAKTYLLLAQKNPKYESQAINYSQKLPELAPTYPISYLTLAKTQAGLGQDEEATASLEKALLLKPDYQEAKDLLDQLNSRQLPETSDQK